MRLFLGVGYLPDRKNPCMYVKNMDTAEFRILATFKSEEAVNEFLSFNPKFNVIVDSATISA